MSRVSLLLLGILALSATLAVSAHEVELEAGAGVNYVGAYPYAPGVAPGPGAFHLPQSAIVGGQTYDCVALINGWGVLAANKMYGLAVYRDGAGVIRGVHTRSGQPIYNAPADPPAVHGHGVVNSWARADAPLNNLALQIDGQRVRNDLNALFGAPRKCFGFAQGAATCVYNNAANRIERTWPNGAQENGAPAGVCALTRIAIHLRNAGIPRNNILCAAERTHGGWNGGRTATGGAANYANGEIVSSCATCQQQVPIILQADCQVAAPANGGMGTCPARLLEGESCAFTCLHGAAVPLTATCINGRMFGSRCPAAPVAPIVHAPVLRRASSAGRLRMFNKIRRSQNTPMQP